MTPAVLHPRALRDQQGEVWYHRMEGGTRLAVKLPNATDAAPDQIELDSGIGLPTLGGRPGRPGLRTRRVARSPSLWRHFERADQLGMALPLAERHDIAAVFGDDFASS